MDGIDDLDRKLIGALKIDGRMRHTDIAARIGVTEGTVRNRMQRLLEDGTLRIVPIIDQTKIGYRLNVWIGLRVLPGTFGKVAQHLASFNAIRYVGACTGAYDVIAEGIFLSEGEMFSFLEEEIPKVDGIVSTESSVVLRIAKLGYEWELREEEELQPMASRSTGGSS